MNIFSKLRVAVLVNSVKYVIGKWNSLSPEQRAKIEAAIKSLADKILHKD